MDEKIAYNALNVFYKGDYSKLDKAWESRGSWGKAWENLESSAGIDSQKCWQNLIDQKISLAFRSDGDFPELLREIPWPPFGLYRKGAVLDGQPAIAIVGTRKATLNGQAIAKKFASAIASAGCRTVRRGSSIAPSRGARPPSS